jgi:hypothetical protein
LTPQEKTLHVADLINNAASYFDLWFPILGKASLDCIGTVCVNTRGSNGLKRLQDHGQKVVALNKIDITFFEQWLNNGLINQDTFNELAIYFASTKDWATGYLLNNAGVFNVKNTDIKSFERLQNFIANDPWALKNGHSDFFTHMQAEIKKRLNS